jgi:hypothetical protein
MTPKALFLLWTEQERVELCSAADNLHGVLIPDGEQPVLKAVCHACT